MLRQREAAEDTVQEATLKAWRRIGQFRDERGGTHLVLDLQLPAEQQYAEYLHRFVA